MQIVISAVPVFNLPLELVHVRLLQKMAQSHYDGACNGTCKPGADGFLYGWAGRMEASLGDAECSSDPEKCRATARQLDLLLKILENVGGLSESEREMGYGLTKSFTAALRRAGEVTPTWQAAAEE